MSTISSYDDALDFMPATEARPAGSSFGAKLRVLWEALADGNAAASRYRQLIARGMSADAASAQVFAEFYGAR